MQHFMQAAIERAPVQPFDKLLSIECAFHARFNRMSKAAASACIFNNLHPSNVGVRVKARSRVREIAI